MFIVRRPCGLRVARLDRPWEQTSPFAWTYPFLEKEGELPPDPLVTPRPSAFFLGASMAFWVRKSTSWRAPRQFPSELEKDPQPSSWGIHGLLGSQIDALGGHLAGSLHVSELTSVLLGGRDGLLGSHVHFLGGHLAGSLLNLRKTLSLLLGGIHGLLGSHVNILGRLITCSLLNLRKTFSLLLGGIHGLLGSHVNILGRLITCSLSNSELTRSVAVLLHLLRSF